jgi:hypothetical protein
VGYGWFGSSRVLGLDGFCYRAETYELCLVLATRVGHVSFVWSGYSGEACELCLVLATGVRHVSSVWFAYRGETYKPVALGYSWVTKVQCHA